MHPPLLLGIDLGTSYFKVGLFDAAGALKGLGRVAVAAHSPATGRQELPVPVFWKHLRDAFAEALAAAGARAAGIAGLSYSSQANTFLLLDEHDAPLTPLILWTDDRAAPLAPRLAAFSQKPEFAQTTGIPGFTNRHAAAKLLWFQRNHPALWSRARRVMTLPDYVTFALTGVRAGDASTAALLGLTDHRAKTWWPAALDACGLDPRQLSAPLAPGAACAETTARAPGLLGVPAGAKFAVGGLDHHVAAIGSGLGRLADMSISTGTVLAAIALTPEVCPASGCIHGPHAGHNGFYRLAFDPDGAGQLETYQRQHAPHLTIAQLITLAENPTTAATAAGTATIAAGIDAATTVAATGAATTTAAAAAAAADAAADADAARHGAAVREILERTAATHRRLVATVAGGANVATAATAASAATAADTATAADACKVSHVVATGGGTRSELWLQIKADALGIPVVTTTCPERACLGAAMFAAVAAGLHPDLETAARVMVHENRAYFPARQKPENPFRA